MKLQQLEYVIAIAQEGSITGAAKKLFQAQPNISIALKELESKIGIQIFWRTPTGMTLTPEGEEFFQRAKKIVDEMHSFEADYSVDSERPIAFRIAATRSAYITAAIGYWINQINTQEKKFSVHFAETNTHRAIEDVGIGKADIGVIRVPSGQSELYQKKIEQRNISEQLLTEFNMKLLMRSTHPLAKYDDVPFEELIKYPELVHGDEDINIFRRNCINPDYDTEVTGKLIYVYDRGSKMSLLNTVENAFMWVSPMPYEGPKSEQIVVKNCSYACIKMRDTIIYRKNSGNEEVVNDCINALTTFTERATAMYRGAEVGGGMYSARPNGLNPEMGKPEMGKTDISEH